MSDEKTETKPIGIPARKTLKSSQSSELSQSAPTHTNEAAAFFKKFHEKKSSDVFPVIGSFEPARPSSANEWRKIAFKHGHKDSQ